MFWWPQCSFSVAKCDMMSKAARPTCDYSLPEWQTGVTGTGTGVIGGDPHKCTVEGGQEGRKWGSGHIESMGGG